MVGVSSTLATLEIKVEADTQEADRRLEKTTKKVKTFTSSVDREAVKTEKSAAKTGRGLGALAGALGGLAAGFLAIPNQTSLVLDAVSAGFDWITMALADLLHVEPLDLSEYVVGIEQLIEKGEKLKTITTAAEFKIGALELTTDDETMADAIDDFLTDIQSGMTTDEAKKKLMAVVGGMDLDSNAMTNFETLVNDYIDTLNVDPATGESTKLDNIELGTVINKDSEEDLKTYVEDTLIPSIEENEIELKVTYAEALEALSEGLPGTRGFYAPMNIVDILATIKKLFSSGQVGIGTVPTEGLYHLHGGETVSRRGQGVGGNIVNSPTFHINASISSDVDVNNLGARLNAMNFDELRRILRY